MSLVSTERHGAMATLRVNNVSDDAGDNLLTTPVMTQLWDALVRIERDPRIRAVVLTGALPGRFIGHYDIDEILTSADRVGLPMPPRLAPYALRSVAPLVRNRRLRDMVGRSALGGVASLLLFHQTVAHMRRSAKVFVAAIDGPAFGGGFELALACDIRVAGDGPFEMGLFEVLIGLLPGGGGSQLLTRTLGTGATIDLLLEGRTFSPQQAYDLGLVQHLVPQASVYDEARSIARRLARRSPMAVRAVKHVVYTGGSADVGRGLATERSWFMALVSRDSAKTALRRYSAQMRDARLAGDDPAEFTGKYLPQWREGTAVEFPAEK